MTSLKTFPDISKFINKSVFNLTIIGDYHPLSEIEREKKIKILLCGASWVRCNTLSKILIGEEFNDNSGAISSFICKDFKFFVNYREIRLILMNGPGEERFRALLSSFIK